MLLKKVNSTKAVNYKRMTVYQVVIAMIYYKMQKYNMQKLYVVLFAIRNF